MTPRRLSIIIAVVFIGCVVAAVSFGAASAIERGSLKMTGALVGLIWIGLAVGLGKGIIRASSVERWFTVLASAAIAAGVYVNSDPQPQVVLSIIGIASGLCAIGLLTPFVGRHFSKEAPAEQDVNSNA